MKLLLLLILLILAVTAGGCTFPARGDGRETVRETTVYQSPFTTLRRVTDEEGRSVRYERVIPPQSRKDCR